MPTWNELLHELNQIPPEDNKRGIFIDARSGELARQIAERCGRNVIYYASAFLQKPLSGNTSIDLEDINGFMSAVYRHDFDKDLLLILHTPGGSVEAAQTIVDYLRSKYARIDVVIPTYAMSAGTMIALACDRIIMGRQSQLGPTDPQLFVGERPYSAHSIVEQFEEAKRDISSNTDLAHAWAPILRSYGPALLQEARKALSYGESLVEAWLREYMFAGCRHSAKLAKDVAKYFSGSGHGSHGRRIGRGAARKQHLSVIDLEDDQELQDEVLSLYHLSTILFENSLACKSVLSSNDTMWVKNWYVEEEDSGPPQGRPRETPLQVVVHGAGVGPRRGT